MESQQSENEIDIFASLCSPNIGASVGSELDIDAILHRPGEEDEDEAYIALQQAASYRKGSSLRGKTVKKGGGFQAMGTCYSINPSLKHLAPSNVQNSGPESSDSSRIEP